MIATFVLPPLLAAGWFIRERWQEKQQFAEEIVIPYSICPSDATQPPADWTSAQKSYTGELGSFYNVSSADGETPER
jgi:hypothetical protein